MALKSARIWLMEQGLRIVERRSAAEQVVIVEYTDPLHVAVRGVDETAREVQWAGSAYTEGNLEDVDASILGELTRQALAAAWGLP